MAKEQTSRFGLDTFTSGSDFHPDREDFNARMELIDEKAAIAEQGDHGNRPLPGVTGRFWLSVDRGDLFLDSGEAWVQVVRIGSGGAGADVAVDSSAAEGTSNRAARADHTHRLPLASQTLPGAMGAGDKAKLDQATSVGSAGRLMQRDEDGRARVADPSSVADIANKRYVDAQRDSRAPSSHTHNADDINTGVLNPDRLPPATSSTNGAMSRADKIRMDNRTPGNVASTLVERSNTGHIAVSDPTSSVHAATRNYVDQQVNNHRHSGADITSGTVDPARLPAATTSTQGAQSAADKAKLDGATPGATGNTLVQRNSAGQFAITTPTSSVHATTKSYVDDNVASAQSAALWRGDLGSRDLNDVDVGNWSLGANALATLARNYPLAGVGGVLEVRAWSPSSAYMVQTYITRSGPDRRFVRSHTGSSWTPWVEVILQGGAPITAAQVPNFPASRIDSGTVDPARLPAATTSVQGAQSPAHKAMLDNATSASVAPNALIRRDDAGNAAILDPLVPTHIANRRYVDRLIVNLRDIAMVDRGVTGADPDTLTQIGVYTCTSGNPVGEWGNAWSLQVLPNSQNVFQHGYDRSTRRAFTRRGTLAGDSVSWTSWTEMASREYVDAQRDTRAPLSHRHNASDINAGVLAPARLPAASQSDQGAQSAEDKTKLDSASSNFGSGGTLVLRDADGRANFESPTVPANAATKGYVDGQIGTRAALAHQHSADDINSGTLAPERLPEATQEAQGALSAEYKALLDSATHQAEGRTLVRRLSSGAFFAAPPESTGHVATRGWVESNAVMNQGNTGTTNLNSIITPGFYSADDSNATSGRNYPVGNSGGALTVLNTGGGYRKQIFDRRSTDGRYTRYNLGSFSSSWSDWKLVYS